MRRCASVHPGHNSVQVVCNLKSYAYVIYSHVSSFNSDAFSRFPSMDTGYHNSSIYLHPYLHTHLVHNGYLWRTIRLAHTSNKRIRTIGSYYLCRFIQFNNIRLQCSTSIYKPIQLGITPSTTQQSRSSTSSTNSG